MAVTFAEVVDRSLAEAAADPKWLGSEAHRALLEESLLRVLDVPNVSVVWLPPGAGSYWEPSTRQVGLERPTLRSRASAAVLAEFTALGLLHEALHARYTTDFGAYRTEKAKLPASERRVAERLFQRLEDARISAAGTNDEPALQPYVQRLLEAAVDQALALADSTGSGEGGAPVSQTEQLLLSIEVYALLPQRSLILRPSVSRRLERTKPAITGLRDVTTTEECGLGAIGIATAALDSGLPT